MKVRWKGEGVNNVEGVGLKSHIAYLPWGTRDLCGWKGCLRSTAIGAGEEGWMD